MTEEELIHALRALAEAVGRVLQEGELLTAEEAGERLRLSSRALKDLASEGLIPVTRPSRLR